MMIVMGGWKRTYGTKNINTTIDCSDVSDSLFLQGVEIRT